jgi:hypothetical protein
MTTIVKGKNYGRNSKRWNRKSNAKIVLFNDYLLKIIIEQLRGLNGVGLYYVLSLRLVCKKWSDRILDLDRWVWRYWNKSNKIIFTIMVAGIPTITQQNSRKTWRTRTSIYDNILRIRKVHKNQVDDWLTLSKALLKQKSQYKHYIFKMKVNYTKVGHMLMKHRTRKQKQKMQKFKKMHMRMCSWDGRKCTKCMEKGQGKFMYCFHCPYLVHKRRIANQKKMKDRNIV